MTYSMDPELAAAVPMIPPIDFADVPGAREMARQIAVSGEALAAADQVDGRDVMVPAGDGAEVMLRIFTPLGLSGPRPAILDIHPGGFCAGSVDNIAGRSMELAVELNAIVAAVEYRLAPENPYPVPLEDCFDALTWLVQHADELGVDPSRVALHGQSGVGGLGAALALLARDRGGPALCFVYLGVPEIDDRLETPSMQAYVDTPLWNRPNAELSWRHYLGELAGGEIPIYAAPARAEDLTGLPPTYVAVMQFDPLRDEGIQYAARLAMAGVPTELHLFPGTFHGSNAIAHAAVSVREIQEEGTVLRRAFGEL